MKTPAEIAEEIIVSCRKKVTAFGHLRIEIVNETECAKLIIEAIIAERARFEEAKDSIAKWKQVADMFSASLEEAKQVIEFYGNKNTWSDNRNIFYFDTAPPLDMDLQETRDGKNKVAGKRARIKPVEFPSESEQAAARDSSFDENVKPTGASRALSHDIGFEAGVAWLKERIK